MGGPLCSADSWADKVFEIPTVKETGITQGAFISALALGLLEPSSDRTRRAWRVLRAPLAQPLFARWRHWGPEWDKGLLRATEQGNGPDLRIPVPGPVFSLLPQHLSMETFLNEAGAVFSQSTGDCCWLSCGEGRQEGLSLTTFGGGGLLLKKWYSWLGGGCWDAYRHSELQEFPGINLKSWKHTLKHIHIHNCCFHLANSITQVFPSHGRKIRKSKSTKINQEPTTSNREAVLPSSQGCKHKHPLDLSLVLVVPHSSCVTFSRLLNFSEPVSSLIKWTLCKNFTNRIIKENIWVRKVTLSINSLTK